MNALVHRETCKLCNLVFSIRISRCAAKLCSDVIVRDSLDDRFHSAAATELRRAPNGLDSSIWCAETDAMRLAQDPAEKCDFLAEWL